jgi:hypothetical protein
MTTRDEQVHIGEEREVCEQKYEEWRTANRPIGGIFNMSNILCLFSGVRCCRGVECPAYIALAVDELRSSGEY